MLFKEARGFREHNLRNLPHSIQLLVVFHAVPLTDVHDVSLLVDHDVSVVPVLDLQ